MRPVPDPDLAGLLAHFDAFCQCMMEALARKPRPIWDEAAWRAAQDNVEETYG
ncbi:MAG TPA: hypothetical protein VM221_05345 [Armatimonadota bacterium]|nr:hypothetical protein [Armatimonadota bacterium]